MEHLWWLVIPIAVFILVITISPIWRLRSKVYSIKCLKFIWNIILTVYNFLLVVHYSLIKRAFINYGFKFIALATIIGVSFAWISITYFNQEIKDVEDAPKLFEIVWNPGILIPDLPSDFIMWVSIILWSAYIMIIIWGFLSDEKCIKFMRMKVNQIWKGGQPDA